MTSPTKIGEGTAAGRRLPTLPPAASSPSLPSTSSASVRRESGYVQFGISYEEPNLFVTLWGAEDVRAGSESASMPPSPYAIVRLCIYG